jgi:hypothetical protein
MENIACSYVWGAKIFCKLIASPTDKQLFFQHVAPSLRDERPDEAELYIQSDLSIDTKASDATQKSLLIDSSNFFIVAKPNSLRFPLPRDYWEDKRSRLRKTLLEDDVWAMS